MASARTEGVRVGVWDTRWGRGGGGAGAVRRRVIRAGRDNDGRRASLSRRHLVLDRHDEVRPRRRRRRRRHQRRPAERAVEVRVAPASVAAVMVMVALTRVHLRPAHVSLDVPALKEADAVVAREVLREAVIVVAVRRHGGVVLVPVVLARVRVVDGAVVQCRGRPARPGGARAVVHRPAAAERCVRWDQGRSGALRHLLVQAKQRQQLRRERSHQQHGEKHREEDAVQQVRAHFRDDGAGLGLSREHDDEPEGDGAAEPAVPHEPLHAHRDDLRLAERVRQRGEWEHHEGARHEARDDGDGAQVEVPRGPVRPQGSAHEEEHGGLGERGEGLEHERRRLAARPRHVVGGVVADDARGDEHAHDAG
mmetsp:Transcript_21310/g.66088  ORF Transcript_21310/g.66088 Transcript_21310/m.66088 type:complete len:366 (-) Transcript_21310:670-1767(-)